jgi:DNA-binding NtrC family response regulator
VTALITEPRAVTATWRYVMGSDVAPAACGVKQPATGSISAVPILVLAPAASSKTIQAALGATAAITATEDIQRARALAATGGFVVILAVEPLAASLRGVIVVDIGDAAAIAKVVNAAIRQSHDSRSADPVSWLVYEEYSELARYGVTRRYLIALLQRHNGSVTDAARGADMKRESLHRLLRRHHLNADDFRER